MLEGVRRQCHVRTSQRRLLFVHGHLGMRIPSITPGCGDGKGTCIIQLFPNTRPRVSGPSGWKPHLGTATGEDCALRELSGNLNCNHPGTMMVDRE
jgi:hypothetical protein